MRLDYLPAVAVAMLVGGSMAAADGGRVDDGLVAWFAFDGGKTIGPAIENLPTGGSFETSSSERLVSDKPAKRLTGQIKESNAITVEAWLTPATTKQTGPARIVTISRDTSHRNVTLGQDGDRFDVRLRTTKTSTNGLPSTASKAGTVTTSLTHVVFTFGEAGVARLSLNGREATSQKIGGDFSNWDGGFRFAIGDEVSGGRRWQGELQMVAVYARELSREEIRRNFEAGPGGTPSVEQLAEQRQTRLKATFETKVAPLLADRCLECHDAATREGGLDLSHRAAAFDGGDSGSAVVAGQSAESLLWTSVESDEMPHDRAPLSDAEKRLLKAWIDDGAVWSLDDIDPAVYEFADIVDPHVRRLTVAEYIETVRAATGVDIADDATALLPKDLRADGFSNTAYNLTVDLKHVQSYAELAATIVGRLDVAAFCKRFSRKRGVNDKDSRALIERMGAWLLRGPLSDDEVVSYRGIVTTVVSAGGDFDEAMAYVIEAMLQSPRFIYRIESAEGDVSQLELATRMSYILWGGPPDEALVEAANDGRLDRGEVARQVDRMLRDPRAKAKSLQFVSEWLNLGRLASMRPSTTEFPDWDPVLAADMRDETLAFFEDVVWEQNRPLGDLLNAQVTFLTTRLANHYRVLLPAVEAVAGTSSVAVAPSTGEPWMRVDTSNIGARGGLLTQGSVLTVGGDEASMVTRGLFVMHDLLRGVVKDPPPCVNTTPVPTAKGVTQRTIAEARLKNEACGGCHAKFEPLAFGLERFDGLGSFAETDKHGNALRSDGDVLIPGEAAPRGFRDSDALMDLLASSPRVAETITWKLTQFAMGRPLGASDAEIVKQIHQTARSDGGTYADVMAAIVLSDLVLE